MTTLIIIVEDKKEEQLLALEAVKRALVPAGSSQVSWEFGGAGYRFEEVNLGVKIFPDLKTFEAHFDVFSKIGLLKMTCILTDLMFPVEKGGREEPNGLQVLTQCIKEAVPVVVCSDTNHHDVGYLRNVFPILGKAHPKGEIPIILDMKDWDQAVKEGLRMMGKILPAAP